MIVELINANSEMPMQHDLSAQIYLKILRYQTIIEDEDDAPAD